MKTITLAAVMAVAGACVLSACAVSAETEKAPGVDLHDYKTFSWTSPSGARQATGMMNQDLKSDIAAALQKKGLTETAGKGDLAVDYTMGSFKGNEPEAEPVVYAHPYTSYWIGRHGRVYSYWNPAYVMGTRYHNVPFTENVLTVDLKDAKTGKIVWEGRAETDITNHPLTTKQAHKDVETLFKRFG